MDSQSKISIAKFDGIKISVISNPDSGTGFIGNFRIFNNSLIFDYSNSKGVVQIGRIK